MGSMGTGAGMGCLMRASIGDIVAADGGRDAILRLLAECWAVTAAAGFPPRSAFTEFVTRLLTKVGSPAKPSMLRDIERGSVTEGDHILDDLAARARALGVATPILDLAASMSPHTRPDGRAKLQQHSQASRLVQKSGRLQRLRRPHWMHG